jgi:hypothetical protein
MRLNRFLGLFVLALAPRLAAAGPLWTATGDMMTARSFHTATSLPSGEVLVTGGCCDDVGMLASSELYDLATGMWSGTGSLAAARANQSATLLVSGEVLVAGGANSGDLLANYGNSGTVLASAELYDPTTGTWRGTGTMGAARELHTATLLPSNEILIAGGCCDANFVRASAELYEPGTGTWSATGSMATARYGHTATLLPSGKVLVAGGADASAELYDRARNMWSSTGSMTTARYGHTATLLASGKVLVAGGDVLGWPVVATAELYDPATGTWSPTGSMAIARTNHTATLLSSGRVLVAGGCTCDFDGAAALASAEVYDPEAGTWSAAGFMEEPRFGATATLLPSAKVLVVGQGEMVTPNAELYDPDGGVPPAISPASAEVAPLASETFTVSGGSGAAYMWSLFRNSSGASLDISGHYTAGPKAGAVDIVAVTDSTGNSARAVVTVTPLVISPSNSNVRPMASEILKASGGSGTNYAWAFITNGSGATLSPSGATVVYTAGSNIGSDPAMPTDVVGVTDSLGNSATAAVYVFVPQPDPDEENPSNGCGVGPGDTFLLLALLVLPLLPSRRKSNFRASREPRP